MKVKSESEVAQSCPTLSDPMDCSLPGSSVHGIFQARVLEWGAIAFSHYCIIGPNNIPEKVTETRTQFSISLVPELVYFLLHSVASSLFFLPLLKELPTLPVGCGSCPWPCVDMPTLNWYYPGVPEQ